jgi:hypothetical protein
MAQAAVHGYPPATYDSNAPERTVAEAMKCCCDFLRQSAADVSATAAGAIVSERTGVECGVERSGDGCRPCGESDCSRLKPTAGEGSLLDAESTEPRKKESKVGDKSVPRCSVLLSSVL